MSPEQETEERLHHLISIAARAFDGPEQGPLSHADYDEIAMIASFLGSRLPQKTHELIAEGYPYSGWEQKKFGERLARVLDFSKKYGEKGSTEGELLPLFSLSESDRERVLKLCGDMRKIVLNSIDFDEPHKKRLLNRVAAIEKQVLSPKGMFDVVLAGVSDVGETLGKFGKDVKPLTDRMSEVARITRKGTKEYDQIPAPEEVKQLPSPQEQNASD